MSTGGVKIVNRIRGQPEGALIPSLSPILEAASKRLKPALR